AQLMAVVAICAGSAEYRGQTCCILLCRCHGFGADCQHQLDDGTATASLCRRQGRRCRQDGRTIVVCGLAAQYFACSLPVIESRPDQANTFKIYSQHSHQWLSLVGTAQDQAAVGAAESEGIAECVAYGLVLVLQ